MRNSRNVLGALAIIALCWWGISVVVAGQKAPDFRLKTMDGETVQFYDQLNRGPILVDFWATWCVPCLKEMVQFQKLYETYHDRGFEIYGITIDNPKTASKIKPTVLSKGFTFPILLDPDKEVLKKFGGRYVVPYVVIVAPDGEIITSFEGYKSGNERVIEQAILPYLRETPPDTSVSESATE